MQIYRTKVGKLAGTNFKEVFKKASRIYKDIKSKTKRRPYMRSAYFNKDKIFLELFWQHLFDKQNRQERLERLQLFNYSIDLIKNSLFEPSSKDNENRKGEILHRFYGLSSDKTLFCVQIKESKRNNQKFLISVFPYNKKKILR